MQREDQPKTRREKKGRDKQSVTPYSSKHVRLAEQLAEKRAKDAKTKKNA